MPESAVLSPLLYLICGFVLLAVGAELLVSASAKLAIRLGIAPLVVGLTIVAFGTSAPELAVSIEAASNGRSALALGNVIGSNIANIGLILGITALICPIRIEAKLVKKQIPILIATSLLLCALLYDGSLGFWDGMILAAGLLLFLYVSYRESKHIPTELEASLVAVAPANNVKLTLVNITFILAGLVLLVVGSHVFVDNAITLAHLFGVSEAIIGLTIVAVGTSIPELATSVVAAVRKQSDIAIGNVIGSNLFNILGILGATAIISAISAAQFSVWDLVIMLGFTCAILPLAWTRLVLNRVEGGFLLLTYCGYVTYLVI